MPEYDIRLDADHGPVVRDAYDRILGRIEADPGAVKARPTTVTTVLPIIGLAQTYSVQTYRTEDGFFGFLTVVDAAGHARVAIPPKVMAALYRQRDSLIKQGRKVKGRENWLRKSPAEREAAVLRLRKPKSA
jgi:hypothetical protein